MEPDFAQINAQLEGQSAAEILRWAHDFAPGGIVVSTNFRPYEAVILHLATRAVPDIPVLWVDHGHNRPATGVFAQKVIDLLKLKIHRYEPLERVEIPEAAFKNEDEQTAEDDAAIHAFSEKVKLEPFRRGMKELAPKVWITALRRVQNPNRAGMNVVESGPDGVVKVNPILDWTDEDMEKYLAEHNLPNEWDYYDPAKAGEKRECGLHTRMR